MAQPINKIIMSEQKSLIKNAQQLRLAASTASQTAASIYAEKQIQADMMAVTLKSGGYLASETALALGDLYKQTPAEKAKSMRDAGYTAWSVATQLRSSASMREIVKILKSVGYSANDVGIALRNEFKVYEIMEVARELQAAGYSEKEIAVYGAKIANTPIHIMAEVFNKLGLPAKEAVNALRQAYDYATTVAVAEALRYAKYGAEEVGRALKDVYNLTADALTDVFKQAKYGAEEAVRVLKNVYNQSATWVADKVKSVYNLGADAVNTVLNAVGYAANQIKDAMKSVFNWFEDILNPTKW